MPTHLSSYQRKGTAYQEHERRFCIRNRGGMSEVIAYEIDISSKRDSYFKEVYRGPGVQGKGSADGLYIGRLYRPSGDLTCIIVIELEGPGTPFDKALKQIGDTLEHFCQNTRDHQLSNGGFRHHQQAEQDANAYSVASGHWICGLMIGSEGRLYQSCFIRIQDMKVPILRINSRQPAQDVDLEELLAEFLANIPTLNWQV